MAVPGDMADAAAFIRDNTVPTRPPLLPEIVLHLAAEVTPLWEATEATLERHGLPPPYWAFAWAGGQAVARALLDAPERVAGRTVLDFACGSAVAGIAAARAGAARVIAVDIDGFAVAAARLNAAANGVPLEVRCADIVGALPDPWAGLILAGDVCYERPMAERVLPWLRELARLGATVLLGDPGRAYRPKEGLEPVARYAVPTSTAIESTSVCETTVWRLLPG